MNYTAKHFLETALEINTYGFFDLFVQYAQHENRVLDLVGRSEANTLLPSTISERLGLSRVMVTLTLNGLEKDGLIVRTPSKTDRRKVLVNMTPKGKKKFEETQQKIMEFVEAMFLLLGEEQTHQLVEMMDKVQRSMKKDE